MFFFYNTLDTFQSRSRLFSCYKRNLFFSLTCFDRCERSTYTLLGSKQLKHSICQSVQFITGGGTFLWGSTIKWHCEQSACIPMVIFVLCTINIFSSSDIWIRAYPDVHIQTHQMYWNVCVSIKKYRPNNLILEYINTCIFGNSAIDLCQRNCFIDINMMLYVISTTDWK